MTIPRTYFPHALFILGLALFAVVSTMLLRTNNALAASFTPPAGYIPLQGYAWAGFLVPGPPDYASGPGWISFAGAASNADTYGVYEGGSSSSNPGALAGYAWSSNYGWISFNPSDITAAGLTPPTVNVSTGQVTGNALVCSAFQSGCSGALNSGTGGWDGRISLSGTATDGSPYGLTQGANCTDWSGYAWGSADVGWVSADYTKGTANAIKCGAPLIPISASCTVSPAVGNTSTPFVWAVSPPTGGAGGPYTYAWTFDGVLSANTTASVTKTYSGTGAHTGSVNVSDNFGGSQVFTCYAVDSSGNQQNGVIVYPTPTATLTASKYTIVNGQSTTLTWSSTNATSGCTGNGFNTSGATSGSIPVSPSVTTPYGVTCSNPGGSASQSITITVKKPTISIGANPTRVSTGTHTKIFWTSIDTTSCIVTGNGIPPASGTSSPGTPPGDPNSGIDSGAITQQTVFTINCVTDGSPVSSQVIVNILPIFQEF